MASLSSLISTATNPEESSGGASMLFDEPVTLDRVEVVCFGTGTMSGTISLELTNGDNDEASQSFQCDQGRQILNVSPSRRADVAAMRFEASESTTESAWKVVMYGKQ
ncbi:hypothetical protein GCM10022219_06680 [Microbacterium oryzae]|uniref:Uncharacterized protein n=1 Tax=Microbacterium oryzae TaxID=743009 RepID=A0A6I6E2Q8_9MICO|nr:hypothetical protein D7D94_03125 [Microbacterium oryzae]